MANCMIVFGERLHQQKAKHNENMSMLMHNYKFLFDGLARLWKRFHPYRHRLAHAMFVPQYYKLQAGLDSAMSDDLAWRHWLGQGYRNDIAISPLFDADYYRQMWGDEKPRIADEPSAFIHWLKHGLPKKIVPTILFDERYYLHAYPDVAASGLWAFEHFIMRGINERRWPNALFNTARYVEKNRNKLNGMAPYYHFLLYGDAFSYRGDTHNFDPREFGNPSWRQLYRIDIEKNREFFDKRVRNGVLAEVFERAGRIEPLIHKPALASRVLNSPPLLGQQAGIYAAAKKARKSLKRPHYDTVVCIPHCRVGGAARVAGLFCNALNKVFPDQPTLLIRTELADFARPAWFPRNIEMLVLSSIVHGMPATQKHTVLLDVLRGVTPKRIININSRLCWDTYTVFGSQLSQWSRLYAYFFCYDMNRDGHKVGYPIEYFAPSFKFMDGYFLDNQALVDELADRYMLSFADRKKMKAIWTPIDRDANYSMHAEKLISKHGQDVKWRAFWAGRLDRQKRYDIVIEIARAMPTLEIWTWGHAVLDEGYDTDHLPPNMKFLKTFDEFDNLPLNECDFWLYTSEWDGLPIMLLETGARGIATVASRVGGTANIINEDTGWPVDDYLDPQAYVAAIKQLIASPNEVLARARNLRDLVKSRHSMERYACEIEMMLK